MNDTIAKLLRGSTILVEFQVADHSPEFNSPTRDKQAGKRMSVRLPFSGDRQEILVPCER